MKTAISLPDELFERAEAVAASLDMPRSQLYAQALSEYLARHDAADITAGLDKVHAGRDADPWMTTAADLLLTNTEW